MAVPLTPRASIPEAEKAEIKKRQEASRALINMMLDLPSKPTNSDIHAVALAAKYLLK